MPFAAKANPELAKKHACLACHTVDKKLVGPGYKEIAKNNQNALETASRVKGIEYQLGQRLSFAQNTQVVSRLPGMEVNRQFKTFTHNIEYDRAGIQRSSVEETVESGLRTTTINEELPNGRLREQRVHGDVAGCGGSRV